MRVLTEAMHLSEYALTERANRFVKMITKSSAIIFQNGTPLASAGLLTFAAPWTAPDAPLSTTLGQKEAVWPGQLQTADARKFGLRSSELEVRCL